MRSRRRRSGEEEAFEINLVPMIDCMLILLIFFMVATTIKHAEKVLPIQLPAASAAVDAAPANDLLTLAVDRDGRKYLRSEPISTELLHRQLAQIAAANPMRPVRIDADRATAYERVVELIELCQFYGLRDVHFHTRSDAKR
jgi:biopolymer transport protein ExbD